MLSRNRLPGLGSVRALGVEESVVCEVDTGSSSSGQEEE